MKYIKLYESFEDINLTLDSICKELGIVNYTINSDGSIDVDGTVNLSSVAYHQQNYEGLTKLPLKFGKVSAYFDCSSNDLITLEGCPQSVSGYFSCYNNKLTTLEFCPQSVGGSFNCSHNKLTKLEFCPQSIGGFFSCAYNQLKTLEGCPKSVGSGFSCAYNKLTTLEGCPQSVYGDSFFCGNNQLKDLYGFPEFFDGEVYYDSNPVTEILNLFKTLNLGKAIDLLNEYDVIQQNGKVVILDRLEEVFHILNRKMPEEINLRNYEVY